MGDTHCSVKDCCNQALAVKNPNLCWTHYKRFKKTGSIEAQYVNKGKKCKVNGCERDAYTKGLCKNHRNKEVKYGSPLVENKYLSTKGKVCIFSGCKEPVRTSGLCTNHYANFIYRKKRYEISLQQFLERGTKKS